MANRSQRGFAHLVLLVVLIVVLAGVGFLVYRHNHPAGHSSSTSKSQTKNQVVISDLQFSKSVDSQGAAVSPTTQFNTSDPTIYTVLTLKSPAKDTRLEFVRYRNDMFVGNGSIKVAKDGAAYAGFIWSVKSGKAHPKGTYKVKVYTNGRYERSATYSVN